MSMHPNCADCEASMTTKAERRIGLTPAFKRIAYYYLKLGYGEYHPENHPHM